MQTVFRVFIFIAMLFAPLQAVSSPHRVATVARKEISNAQTILRSSGVQLKDPVIATADSLLQATAVQEHTAMKFLLGAIGAFRQWGSHQDLQPELPSLGVAELQGHNDAVVHYQVLPRDERVKPAPLRSVNPKFSKAPSLTEVHIHLRERGSDSITGRSTVGMSAVQLQPAKSGGAPSLLQTSEMDGGSGFQDFARATQHAIMHGLPIQWSELCETWDPRVLMALLGFMLTLATVTFRLAISRQYIGLPTEEMRESVGLHARVRPLYRQLTIAPEASCKGVCIPAVL